MIGGKGKNNAWQQAYLAGIQAQTSVYGATNPVYYGRTRGTPLIIWQNGLRQGAGISSTKKGKKKGAPNYVENVDFLLGHNPIAGVLQFWYNNTTLDLNFEKVSGSMTSDGNGGGYFTVVDTNYYFVLAVTADVTYDVTFDDYGATGPVTQSGTYELPLWNVNYAGPDPTNQNGYRVWPAVYQWVPYSGATVRFPAGAVSGIPHFTGTINVYYAALAPGTFRLGTKSKAGTYVPITALRLAFESVLGSGSEYTGYTAQQIEYPMYAGMGSSDLDLGSGGVAAAILPEVMGMFPVNPSGDADYPDMIEDIFKSGPAQAGTGAPVAYGTIHHGLGCCDFPGTIQKKVGVGAASLTYDLPNTAGNFLFVLATKGTGTMAISDTAGNTWTALMTAGSSQLWRCVAKAAAANVVTLTNTGSNTEITLLEIGGLDTLDGSAVVTTGTGGVYSGSIPTTNLPGENSLILSFVVASGTIPPAPFHWENSTNQANTQIDERAQLYPNSYSVSYSFASGETWTGVLVALKNSQPNTFTLPLGDILDDLSMQQTRLQCRAYGLNGSLFMGSQKKASDWLIEIYRVANSAPVWSGFKLLSIPYAEQSYAGNGAIYESPTAAGPIALIGDDFIADAGEAPVVVSRNAQVDAPDLQQIQFPNRASNYDQTVTAQPDNGSMTLYGTRKADPKTFPTIQTTVVSLMILGMMIREANLVRNTYQFKLQPKWCGVLPMDIFTIPWNSTMPVPDPRYPTSLPVATIPIRLTSVEVDQDFSVTCEAEPFIYGMRTPIAQSVTEPQGYAPGFGADPGSVNAPIIFEAVTQLSEQANIAQLWLVTSGASISYGGCVCYISTDGGMSYNPLGPNGGVIEGSAAMGITVGDWPAHASPDTTNDLHVDLTESLGTLASYQVADEDSFTYPCYVSGSGSSPVYPIPYELMTYALANMTAANKYTLKATGGGNHLDRGVFGAPAPGVGVDHPGGAAFAFLDPNNPLASGILRVPMLPTWVGVTLYFKFPAFNTTGGGLQTLASATVYSYTPTGLPGGTNPGGLPPNLVTVN